VAPVKFQIIDRELIFGSRAEAAEAGDFVPR
jgi:hypothetical protein